VISHNRGKLQKFSHNTIQQSGQRDSYAGLTIDGASIVQITANTIQQNSWHGLDLSGDVSVVTLHNNMIRENAGHGVKLSPVWQATLTSNTIHRNGIPHHPAAVHIASCSHTTLMHNTITYNTEVTGVNIGKSSRGRQANAVLIGNIVNHNSIGFRVRHFHRVILQKNVINFNDYTGVATSYTGARTNLSGNNIRLNGRRGFDLLDVGNVLLKNNLITGNGTPELFGGGGVYHRCAVPPRPWEECDAEE
jgi:parallel beta-helix repeat protein